jgi:hypothetical protein
MIGPHDFETNKASILLWVLKEDEPAPEGTIVTETHHADIRLAWKKVVKEENDGARAAEEGTLSWGTQVPTPPVYVIA